MQIWACRMHMTELKQLGSASSALVMNYHMLGIIVCTPYACSIWTQDTVANNLLSAAYREDRLYLCTSSIGGTIPAREQHSPQYTSSSHRASTKLALEIEDSRH